MRSLSVIATLFGLMSRSRAQGPAPGSAVQGDDAQLWDCGTSPRQTWTVENGNKPFNHIYLAQSYNTSTKQALVLDIAQWSNSTGSEVHVWLNSTGSEGYNEGWTFSGGTIVSTMNGLCLESSGIQSGARVVTNTCKSGSPNQQWAYDASSGAITQGGFCLDAGSAANCSLAPWNGYLYCNPDAATEDRVVDLVNRFTPLDFQNLLSNQNGGVPRLGVPAIQFSECLHGTLSGCGAPYTDPDTGYTSSGCPTSFPHLLLLGSTLNRTLWKLIGNAISDENRGLHNQGVTGSIFWAPDINEFRDPRWGRGQEVPGEDVMLTSEFASIYPAALQFGTGAESEKYAKIVATCKHATAYDLENWGGFDRGSYAANLTMGDWVEYYSPAFRSCIQRAKVKSIMCSYNAVNGVGPGPTTAIGIPSCADGFVQNGVFRGQWGWDGFIVSDCGAIANIPALHHYTNNWPDTIGVAIKGGTDTACDSAYSQFIVDAYNNGTVSMSDLQTAGVRFMRAVFSLGIMDPPSRVPYNSYGPERVDTAAHRQLAFEAATQGIVLLQNNPSPRSPNGPSTPLLPLQPLLLEGKKVAMIGPNANATRTMLSNYHGDNTVVMGQSPLLAMQRRATAVGFSVGYAPGCVGIACANNSLFSDATTLAASSDLAIVVVGLCSDDCPNPSEDNQIHESEAWDRVNITLPGMQEDLVRAVLATGVPTIVALMHGGAISFNYPTSDIPAILDVHYPGEMGGDATAAILFGDVSPSGRLVTTTYPPEFIHQRNMSDQRLAPHDGRPGITHLYYDGPVQWPFGFGLSYTTFSYAWYDQARTDVSVDAAAWAAGEAAPPAYAVNVTNTGSVTSDVSVMAFYSTGLPGEPIQELFDFQRASALAPGQSVTLYFTMPAEIAATVSDEGEQALTPGRYRVRIGDVPRSPGEASESSFVQGTFTITGEEKAVLFSLEEARKAYEVSMGRA